jgi:DNA polymerase-3 subunit gamma/tau
MGSEVFYRKWRPQTLAELVGQEPVVETLRRAVESGEIAHAYLFCGPRGTGKTSTGRILAKAVNCANQARGEPCNICNMCRSITEGRAPDVIEIDAASNRGIDEVRSLREKVHYAPNLARYKVYIVDEVHMLTEAASNALLKTLEEPPPHVIFVLATTEPHKVLPTVMSRCQRFNFRRLAQEAIVDKLKLICQEEDINVGPDSLKLIAQAATGSLRDAENLLQQLVAYYGNQIEFDQIRMALGFSTDLRVGQLAKCIADKDILTGLQIINSVNNDGIDLRQFNLGLVEYLRGLLLVKSGCEEGLDVTGENLAEMRSVVTGVGLEHLLRATKLFAGIDFRTNNYSSLPLELALVDCVLSSMAEQPTLTVAPESGESTVPSQVVGEACQESDFSAVNEAETPKRMHPQNIDHMRGRWKEFIQSLRGEGSNGNLDAFLRSACEPMALEDDTLTLGFYYSFHKEKIEDPKYRHLVEKKLKEVFGQPYKLKCILVNSKRKVPPQDQSPLIKAALEMGAEISD